MQSAPACQVWNMFQPPWPGGVFLARRAPTVPQSSDEIDVHAELLQQVGGDVAQRLVIGMSWATRQVTGSPA